jgi:hypothetical protein
MKHSIPVLLVIAAILPVRGYSQLNNGGLYSLFGVDADTRSNYLRFGNVTGAITSDDWFAPSGQGSNVIDTSNAAAYRTSMQSGANISFAQRMSRLLYAKVNGRLWLDAAYGRDYQASGSAKDSSVFTSANKNGDDPNGWQGGISSVPIKNDLTDVYAHMRRDGTSIQDSLWFFSGAATYGNAANSYYNIELYKNALSYNPSTGVFTSAGASGGHSEWLFDAAGNIIQTGDVIVAVSFVPGATPTVDVRIWVSQATYTTYTVTTTPARFDFSAFSTSTGLYGYASIVSKTGTTAFGAAISNYSGTPSQDTTYNTPWGSDNSGVGWSMQYQQAQFIEVALNMTRIGVDPALYSTLNPCQSMFANIFFASRSSSSFTSSLKDFVAPLTFLRQPVMDYSLQGDTLRCNHVTGMITLTNNSTAAWYSWTVAGGGSVTGANSDSSQLTISKPGTYIVSSSPAQGCPTMKTDTIVIPIDTFPTKITANAGVSGPNIDLYGANAGAGDSAAFGGSQGLTWNWTGPNSFVSNAQNPITDSAWGTYRVTATEVRNGCTTQTSITLLSSMFKTLATDAIRLSASSVGGAVQLSWKDLNPATDQSYVVERSDGRNSWQQIGEVANPAVGEVANPATGEAANPAIANDGQPASFHFTDPQPITGMDLYRIKVNTTSGAGFYSPVVTVGVGASLINSIWLSTQIPHYPTLVVKAGSDFEGQLVLYDLSGEVLAKQSVAIHAGTNYIPAGATPHPSLGVAALFVDNRIAWCQKVLY